MRRIFYSSPVDHRNLGDWPALAQRLRRAASAAIPRGVEIETGGEPVFGYRTAVDGDLEETLLGLEDLQLAPRALRVDLWCSIVHYGAVCVSHGDGIVRKERRALDKALARALRGEAKLRETEGAFDRYEGRVYGYALDPDDDRDRSTIASLMTVFDPPLYVGERWLLQNEREEVDAENFFLVGPAGADVVRFMATDEESDACETLWRNATRGQGLVAVYDDDPGLDDIVRLFGRFDDLRRFVRDGWAYRVTFGRCRPEDSLVVVYDLETGLLDDQQTLFVI